MGMFLPTLMRTMNTLFDWSPITLFYLNRLVLEKGFTHQRDFFLNYYEFTVLQTNALLGYGSLNLISQCFTMKHDQGIFYHDLRVR